MDNLQPPPSPLDAEVTDASPAEESPADRVATVIGQLFEQVNDPALRPDPDRQDWPNMATQVNALTDRWEQELLPLLLDPHAGTEQDDPKLREWTEFLGLELGARLELAGHPERARHIIEKALSLSPVNREEHSFREMPQNPRAFARYLWADTLLLDGDDSGADEQIARMLAENLPPSLRERVEQMRDRPRAIASAPTMFTFNGIGTMLYGQRDTREDGTYVSTLFFTFIFFPVFAISAYRLFNHGDGNYSFYTRERLGPLARGWNYLLLGGGAFLFLALMVLGWHVGDERQSARMLAEAETLEADGRSADALVHYMAVIETYRHADTPAVGRAVEGAARLALEQVERPLTPATVGDAEALIQRFSRLPAGPHRRAQAAALITGDLDGWLEDLDGDDLALARARMQLLSAAIRLHQTPELTARHERELLDLAQAVENDWPADSLLFLQQLSSPSQGAGRAEIALRRLLEAPAALTAHMDSARRFSGQHRTLVQQAEEVTTQYRQLADRRPTHTVDDDAADLRDRRWLEVHPEDQVVAMRIAERLISDGNYEEARTILTNHAPPGLLTNDALLLLVHVLIEEGDLEQALTLIRHVTDHHLPRYLAAASAWNLHYESLIDDIVNRASNGTLPAADMARLINAPDDQAEQVFLQYVTERVERDTSLSRMQTEIDRDAHAVGAVFLHGRTAIELAQQHSGDRREALLLEAERVYRSIQRELAGTPDYHLSLGQVYHRLGRTDEARAEFERATADGTFEPLMVAAHIHRELGLVEEARGYVTRALGAARNDDDREGASALRYHLADDDDERREALDGAPDTGRIAELREEMRGHQHMREGDFEAAAAIFRARAIRLETIAEHDAAAANNAAVAWLTHFECTGDPADLERAAQVMTRAVRSQSDHAIVTYNAAHVHLASTRAASLGQLLALDELRPDTRELGLLGELAWHGSDAQRYRRAFLRHRGTSEARSLLRRGLALAPSNGEFAADLLALHRLGPDVEALERLHEHLRHVRIDSRDMVMALADARTGEVDEQSVIAVSSRITRARERLEGLDADPATRDAARLLLADALLQRFNMTRTTEDAREAVQVLDAVRSGTLAHAEMRLKARIALTLALVRDENPELDTTLAVDALVMGVSPLLLHHMHREQHPHIGSILAHPEFATARDILDELPETPTANGWLLADLLQATDSPQLAYAQQRHAPLVANISLALAPGHPAATYLAELFPLAP